MDRYYSIEFNDFYISYSASMNVFQLIHFVIAEFNLMFSKNVCAIIR